MPGPAALAALLVATAAAPEPVAPGAAPPGAVRLEVEDAESSCALALEAPAGRVDAARLRAAARLRPDWTGSWLREIVAVEASPWMDPPGRVERALPLMEAVLARFDAEALLLAPAPELEPVLRWTREDLAFRLWLVRAELDFCRGDPRALARAFGDLDAGRRCAAAAAKVAALPAARRCREAAYEWGNCINRAFRSRQGEFPLGAWEAFLRAGGAVVQTLRCEEP